jgi:hypothetical protein
MTKRTLNLFVLVITLTTTKRDWSLTARLRNGFVLGIGSWFGNCFTGIVIHADRFSPAIKFHYKAMTSYVGFNPKTRRFYYNSEHIARKYGTAFEAPHGTCFSYTGILGRHDDI